MDRTTLRKSIPWMAMAIVLFYYWDAAILWPLKITVVLFHELGHALAAWFTGGSVHEIGLSPRQGGVTITSGGNRFLILNAGYLGSLAWGVALLMSTRTPRAASAMSWFLAFLLGGVALFIARPLFGFGFFFTVAASLAFAAVAHLGAGELVRVCLRTLGVFSILYAAFDVRDDVFRSHIGAVTDATMLAELTLIPAPVWGFGWLLVGMVLLYVLRREIV